MTMSQHTAETAASITTKAAPPVTVVGAKLAGMPVADWVTYLTAIYLVMMIAHKGWHMYKEWRTGRESSE